jgi:hypothetical protein
MATKNWVDTALNLGTRFSESFGYGNPQPTEAEQQQERIFNSSVNGSGPSDPDLAALVPTSWYEFLFGKPKGDGSTVVKTSTTPTPSSTVTGGLPATLFKVGLLALVGYVLYRLVRSV